MTKKTLKFKWQLITLDVDKLIPYEFNNKDHPERQVNILSNIIGSYGYTDEIIIDKNNIIIAWHWRLEAIKKMWYEAVEVKQLDIDSKDASAYRLLHNKIAELAETNYWNIVIELEQLEGIDIWDITIKSLYPELDLPTYDPSNYNPEDNNNWDVKSIHITILFDNEDDKEELLTELKDRWYKIK